MRPATPISREQLMKIVPSVFAEHAHEGRSKDYAFIPTINLVDGLAEHGFLVREARQTSSREEGMKGFAKHLLYFRQERDFTYHQNEFIEIALKNSHNGASAYEIILCLYRYVCSNGAISGNPAHIFKIRHMGNILDQVIAASYSIYEQSVETLQMVNEWKHIQLDREEQLLLAEYAKRVRFDEYENVVEGTLVPQSIALTVYQPEAFLKRRRTEDIPSTLYNTYQVLQENLTKGGVESVPDEKGKTRKTRPIKGIDKTVEMNKLLWQFTEALGQFRAK